MKIILSRKGFDTGYGGIANPILPDGRFHPLPIPYGHGAPIRYQDLPPPEGLGGDLRTLADFVMAHGATMKRKKPLPPLPVTAETIAHLDPDLAVSSLRRMPGWRPLFGQTGDALRILRNRQVGPGSLFIFFGRYDRLLSSSAATPQYEGKPFHCVFGWLQVGRIHQAPFMELPAWARYHPHAAGQEAGWHPTENVIFEAADRLSVPGLDVDLPGAGILPGYHENLRLTAPKAVRSDDWRLPAAFAPLMSKDRWTCVGGRQWSRDHEGAVRVNVMGPWQEGVFDLADAPETIGWLAEVFRGEVGDPSLSASSSDGSVASAPSLAVVAASSVATAPLLRSGARSAPRRLAGPRVLVISPGHGKPPDRLSAWEAMLRGGYVAIGFAHWDFSGVPDRETLQRLLDTEVEPRKHQHAVIPKDFKPAHAGRVIGDFLFRVAPGDLVIVKDGDRGVLGCGRIESAYRFDRQAHPTTGIEREAYSHFRDVEWLSTAFVEKARWPATMKRWPIQQTLAVYESANEPWIRHYLGIAGIEPAVLSSST